MSTMVPVTVEVLWSEAGDRLARAGGVQPFRVFEARARREAEGHATGGYLKTQVRVRFDSGDTYECRLDLGATHDKGFEHAIRERLVTYDRRRAEMGGSPDWMAHWDDLRRVWARMSFEAPAWWGWEVGALRAPVDWTFCTEARAPSYRTEFTAAGEQTVIPGCEMDDERTGMRQMSLF